MESTDDFKKKVIQEAAEMVEKIQRQAAEAISTLLMTMNKEQKIECLNKIDAERLERVFIIAQEKEDYEVCQEIQLIIKKRTGIK